MKPRLRSAFQNLLSAFAQSANWVLIPEQTLAYGKRPDGTMRDSFHLPRGYWEAIDTTASFGFALGFRRLALTFNLLPYVV